MSRSRFSFFDDSPGDKMLANATTLKLELHKLGAEVALDFTIQGTFSTDDEGDDDGMPEKANPLEMAHNLVNAMMKAV